MEIAITEVGSTSQLFLQREFIGKSDVDAELYSYSFMLDLQELWGVVPDYREFQFYVETRIVSSTETNQYVFRVNRGIWNDSHLL